MKTTPEFSDAEIQDVMDFRQVLALTEAAHQRRKKLTGRILTAVLITLVVGGGVLVYQHYEPSQSGTTSQTPASADPSAPTPMDTTRQSISLERAVDTKKPGQNPRAAAKKTEATAGIRVDSAKSAFVPAEPAAGYPALYDYFAKELNYPQQSIKDSVQGVILVSFVINAEGKPEQVSTDHLLGEAFEREAIRLIEQMPAWKPALLDGSPVSSKVSVPITFSVKTIKTNKTNHQQ